MNALKGWFSSEDGAWFHEGTCLDIARAQGLIERAVILVDDIYDFTEGRFAWCESCGENLDPNWTRA